MNAVRVLHVLGAMNRGGAETWLMHVLRHLDPDRFQTDFLVHSDQPAAYDEEILARGSRILRCPNPQNPLIFGKQFQAILRQSGPFDVVHSHVHHYSGYIVSLARAAGIPIRIAHSHSDTRTANDGSGALRTSYLQFSRWLIEANCTHGIAASVPAALALFGPQWEQDSRFKVLYCGIDLDPFRISSDRKSVRSDLGFPGDPIVFGHVGRFVPVKNHTFLVEVAAQIVKREPRARFLFVGDGPLRPALEDQLRNAGLRERVVFAGLRPDVPLLMMHAMDAFLFPSLYEGLPLVLMETQAAGLPCIASEGTPPEAIVNPALVQRLPLSAGAHEWARVACETAKEPPFDRGTALDIVAASRFSINRSVRHLHDIYLQGAPDSMTPNLILGSSVGRNRE
jgi:glycosyltransferase involved in cell wall biosynthesis